MTDQVTEALVYKGPGGVQGVKVLVIGRDADGTETGRYESGQEDLITQQWAQFCYTNIFGTTGSIIAITGSTISTVVWSTLSALTIAAGTGTNAAQVNDHALQTIAGTTAGTCPGTLSAFPAEGAATSGSFTITGTITNNSGGTINYSEIGIEINDNAAHTYLLTHDVFVAVPVSNTGTLSITYTITNS